MQAIYFFLLLMLAIALTLISVPFIRSKTLFSKSYGMTTALALFFILTLYIFHSENTALRAWVNGGKEHYDLLLKFKEAGGIDGMIIRIKQKLAESPTDAEGWFILGKLYLSKEDYKAAKFALNRAHELKPNDQQINFYLGIANR
jgi:cytochrome c-type biogenesis protein CcmH/NrfG